MQWQQTLYCLQLNDYLIGDDQIKPIAGINMLPLVLDRQLQLADKAQITQTKLYAQTFLIRRLKQTRPQSTMHFDRRTDNFLG